MRPNNAVTYLEKKACAEDCFGMIEAEGWTVEQCSEWATEEWDPDELKGAAEMLLVLAIAEYEVRHDILEDRVRNAVSYHIYRYENMGRYKADLFPEEIPEVEKDIAYIKSKVDLPEIASYEDREFG